MVALTGPLRLALNLISRRVHAGGEHIPRSGGVIICPNHLTQLDPPVIGEFLAEQGRWPRFLAMSSLFTIPVLGGLLRRAGQIPVQRDTIRAVDSLVAAKAQLEAGHLVVVYPEGRMSLDPQLWPMVVHTGAARLALETGCPLVPLAQWGAQSIIPPHHLAPIRLGGRQLCRVLAGPAIRVDAVPGEEPDRQLVRELSAQILDAVTGLLEQLRGQERPTGVWDPRLGVRVPLSEALR